MASSLNSSYYLFLQSTKHFRIIAILFVVSFSSNSQTIAPQIVNTTGNNISGTQGSLEYSIGELAIETLSNTTHKLSQGFLQNYTMLNATTTSTVSGLASNIQTNEIAIFPNPTESKVIIVGSGKYKTMIFNCLGVFIKEEYAINEISITELPSGIYLFKIYNQDNLLIKTQKITKL